MSDNPVPPSPTSPSHRRSSFAGQTFGNIFGAGRSGSMSNQGTSPTSQMGPITSAAMAANTEHRRRMSISTVGLSGTSPTSPSFARNRTESVSSASSSNPSWQDESAVEDGDATPNTPMNSAFGRRMSFGARALRDARSAGSASSGNGGNGTQRASPSARSYSVFSASAAALPSPKERHMSSSDKRRPSGVQDGFNWGESLRTRAESTVERSSFSAAPNAAGTTVPRQEVQPTPAPPVQMQAKPRVPDAFQERILKGDFYMD
jgi:hypothetical protein